MPPRYNDADNDDDDDDNDDVSWFKREIHIDGNDQLGMCGTI